MLRFCGIRSTCVAALSNARQQMTTREMASQRLERVLIANRGEVALRVVRACKEESITSIAVHSTEDTNSRFRTHADEAYSLGSEQNRPYLNIDGLVEVAKRVGADGVHPGYGFLSENAEFAGKIEQAGIAWIGPEPRVLQQLGDKTAAREVARAAGVPMVEGTESVHDVAQVREFAREHGYPIMVKACAGGGGRGMRVVRSERELDGLFNEAQREAEGAFGDGSMFAERFVERPRHIEVQILADGHGNVVHLHERDCSVQRRHQKVVEIAPAVGLSDEIRNRLFEDSIKLAKAVGYRNAGTVEFLVEPSTGKHFFMEVNPRLQVEHTVTEQVTGVDIVRSQLGVAGGRTLQDLNISQDLIHPRGYAVQCRVTTEVAQRNFQPDTGRVTQYRSPGGFGVRLDSACFTGYIVSPFYDSLLCKVTGSARTFREAARKTNCALGEFRVEGVTTNIAFLQNVLAHEEFLAGNVDTSFIEVHADKLFKFARVSNQAQRLLSFLGEVAVNGSPCAVGADLSRTPKSRLPDPIVPPVVQEGETPAGVAKDMAHRYPYLPQPSDQVRGENFSRATRSGAASMSSNVRIDDITADAVSRLPGWRHILTDKSGAGGPEAFARAVRKHPHLLVMDTTMRDAHQSLLATRVRTRDLANISPFAARALAPAYALENWGGATFDVCMRFLREDPWHRLDVLRELVPNIPFSMLLRGANAVGYTSYPDNVVDRFCEVAARKGMDVFRVFDALNDMDNLKVGINAAGAAGGVVEAAICYTGDVSDPDRKPYTLDYYMNLVDQIVKQGTHVLAIKDMAGVLKPQAATLLVSEIRRAYPDLPIHVHTHDTAGVGVASMLACAEAGADVVDVATDSMSGTTSQPSLGALAHSLMKHPTLDCHLDPHELEQYNNYWEETRELYTVFEAVTKSGNADVFETEMPGGQVTNLQFQAAQLGLAGRWPAIKRAYIVANRLLGNPPKVTPSSKVVGDLAQFLVANNLTEQDVLTRAGSLSFPESVIEYFQGFLGHLPWPWPEWSKEVVKGRTIYTDRPGASMPPFDFEAARRTLASRFGEHNARDEDVLSHALYPAVFDEFMTARGEHGNVGRVPTQEFLAPMQPRQSITVGMSLGREVNVKFLGVGSAVDPDTNQRPVLFELNGAPRTVLIKDTSIADSSTSRVRARAASDKPGEVASPQPGLVTKVCVKVGDRVAENDVLVMLSAMKMETHVRCPVAGVVTRIEIAPGDTVASGDLLVEVDMTAAMLATEEE